MQVVAWPQSFSRRNDQLLTIMPLGLIVFPATASMTTSPTRQKDSHSTVRFPQKAASAPDTDRANESQEFSLVKDTYYLYVTVTGMELAMSERMQHGIEVGADAVLRWSLVLFFVGFGLQKFTPGEVRAIAPLFEHSSFLSLLSAAFGVQGASSVIGVVDLALRISMAVRHQPARVGLRQPRHCGRAAGHTQLPLHAPGVGTDPWQSGFLAKDLTLFGAVLWCAADVFAAARSRRGQPLVTGEAHS